MTTRFLAQTGAYALLAAIVTMVLQDQPGSVVGAAAGSTGGKPGGPRWAVSAGAAAGAATRRQSVRAPSSPARGVRRRFPSTVAAGAG